jgi:formamidopyrimidine-DNA glycosylase
MIYLERFKTMARNLEEASERLSEEEYSTFDIRVDYMAKDASEAIYELIGMINRDGLDCEYCKSIDESTSKSPRRKYKYCPMCGKERK